MLFGRTSVSRPSKRQKRPSRLFTNTRVSSFRYIHDLEELGKNLEDSGVPIPSVIKEAAILTKYASETRYPGPFEPVIEEEYREAVRLAEAVVQWAEKIIHQDNTS